MHSSRERNVQKKMMRVSRCERRESNRERRRWIFDGIAFQKNKRNALTGTARRTCPRRRGRRKGSRSRRPFFWTKLCGEASRGGKKAGFFFFFFFFFFNVLTLAQPPLSLCFFFPALFLSPCSLLPPLRPRGVASLSIWPGFGFLTTFGEEPSPSYCGEDAASVTFTLTSLSTPSRSSPSSTSWPIFAFSSAL